MGGVIHTWRLQAAAAKFAFVNRLGSIPVMPTVAAVVHIYQYLKERRTHGWKSDPGDLAFFLPERFGGESKAKFRRVNRHIARIMAGGGPFLKRTTSDLVEAVLRRTGYIQPDETVCKQAIALFCKHGQNSAALAEAGLPASSGLGEADLYEAFSNQEVQQRYRCAPSDRTVRGFLARRAALSSVDANTAEVKSKMQEFLKETYPDMAVPPLYAELVTKMLEHFNPNNPTYRELKGEGQP